MQILVIEDDETRQRWLQDTLESGGHDVRLADTADAALDQFRETLFDLAFFDHDLGLADTWMLPRPTRKQLGEPNGSRLLGVVLRERRYLIPKAIWVHSANPVGAENIASKCRSAEIPYHVEDYGTLIRDPEAFLKSVSTLCQATCSVNTL
jgi:CheY-like chemotaxis protein